MHVFTSAQVTTLTISYLAIVAGTDTVLALPFHIRRHSQNDYTILNNNDKLHTSITNIDDNRWWFM